MKVAELRNKSIEDLNKELIALLQERFNLRMQKGTGQPPKTHLFKKVKVAIAQVKTILDEKGRSA